MKNKSLWIILGIVAVVAVWAVSSYNGLVGYEESVDKAWANVESAYQRRSDLIPNLVNTVKGYAEHESATLQAVTDARANATSINIDASTATPEEFEAWAKAQQEVGSALGRLIAVSESYPNLKANENFRDLQTQLEGTENRIKTERDRYNETVKEYNVKIRRFPTNILASLFGFERREMFKAQEGSEIAPVVEF
ncbi:MAG: LemA family protein [Alistipes sp.]|nr:LemA family protein [Alistipes sp.]